VPADRTSVASAAASGGRWTAFVASRDASCPAAENVPPIQNVNVMRPEALAEFLECMASSRGA
jgi:hypothetical protein